MKLALFLAPLCILGAQPNVEDLVRQSDAANAANDVKASQYAYREHIVNIELDSKGQPKKRHTETWEGIGLEGAEYRKLIERDGKPLSAKDQKKEEEKMRKEAERRRKEKANPNRKPSSRSRSVSFTKDNMHLFEVRLAGEEVLDGRPAYVIEATPKADAKPRDSNERELLRTRFVRWVDRESLVDARWRLEFVGQGQGFFDGTWVEFGSHPLEDGTWLVGESRAHVVTKGESGDQVATRSDYRKFTVDSRVVE